MTTAHPPPASGSRSLPLDRLHPGMVLAEPLTDRHGEPLLAAGTILSGSLLAALSTRGVGQLVVSMNGDTPLMVNEQDTEPARRRVAHLFRRMGDDAVTRALAETVLDFRTGKSEWTP